MFYNATAFNQNISNWDTSSAGMYNSFYVGSALSSSNVPAKFR
ncbi:BspA family leucine-rich repeat surface protein [Vibrio parahaemolyticus]|nr:BspA family leucine-rich repeat surface protein [Vibrio parahaemolyticus]EJE8772541.1 BspA family leucine-rich repeat surface protein [Vibrio parahaemolyticus]